MPRCLTASADECARKLDELLAVAKAWQPTMDECVGALIWMTPTLNGYFDDWKNSRYDPVASQGRYVAESRVLDMQGIMSSLALVCNAILPRVEGQNAALAKQLKYEYDGILGFLQRVDERDKTQRRKNVHSSDRRIGSSSQNVDRPARSASPPIGSRLESQNSAQTDFELNRL